MLPSEGKTPSEAKIERWILQHEIRTQGTEREREGRLGGQVGECQAGCLDFILCTIGARGDIWGDGTRELNTI